MIGDFFFQFGLIAFGDLFQVQKPDVDAQQRLRDSFPELVATIKHDYRRNPP